MNNYCVWNSKLLYKAALILSCLHDLICIVLFLPCDYYCVSCDPEIL